MTLPVVIQGHEHTNARLTNARVTRTGQLVVGSFAFNLTKFNELGTAGTAANFYKPKANQQFVIDGVIATADKQVGANEDAVVTIFEATDDTTSTQDKVLLTFVMTQSSSLALSKLNILVSEGKFVNAETDNDDIHLNILGFYIPGKD